MLYVYCTKYIQYCTSTVRVPIPLLVQRRFEFFEEIGIWDRSAKNDDNRQPQRFKEDRRQRQGKESRSTQKPHAGCPWKLSTKLKNRLDERKHRRAYRGHLDVVNKTSLPLRSSRPRSGCCHPTARTSFSFVPTTTDHFDFKPRGTRKITAL